MLLVVNVSEHAIYFHFTVQLVRLRHVQFVHYHRDAAEPDAVD